MGIDRLLDGLRRRHHTAHDGRSRIRRRSADRPALEQNGLPHRRGIHHTPLRHRDAETLHLHIPFHLDFHHRFLPLSDCQNHRNRRRNSALVQYPDTRRVLHDIRLARRPSCRSRDRRAAIHHPLRCGHHRHPARIRRSGRRPRIPRTGPGGILHPLRGGIQLGVHRRVHALQPLLSGRKLGLRPAIYERAHAQRGEKGRRAIRRAVYLQPYPVDAAADDLPRLRTRTFGTRKRKRLPADVQADDARRHARTHARRHDLRDRKFAERHIEHLCRRFHQRYLQTAPPRRRGDYADESRPHLHTRLRSAGHRRSSAHPQDGRHRQCRNQRGGPHRSSPLPTADMEPFLQKSERQNDPLHDCHQSSCQCGPQIHYAYDSRLLAQPGRRDAGRGSLPCTAADRLRNLPQTIRLPHLRPYARGRERSNTRRRERRDG